MSDILSVYCHGENIGDLRVVKGLRYVFSYKEEWLQRGDAIPISLSLPLTPGEFSEESSMSFFSNLLPESTIRRRLAKKFRISEKDSYGLLKIIGGECAGAISILSSETKYEQNGGYEKIDNESLGELLANISKWPLCAGEQGVRLSLAGAQDKLPIYYDGNNFFLPKGNKASTHIIKTAISDEFQFSVLNEAFCMRLAKELDLPVPEISIIRNTHEPFFLIKRYDRVPDDNGNIIRLHQEDFCQALGISPENKYEENGGPSLVDCFNLVSENSTNPAIDKQYLLKWIMFNLLIGNADSHAKNLSFLYDGGDLSLAQFYDLLCTKVYPTHTEDFSMKIGRRKNTRYLNVNDWKKLAKSIDVKYDIFPMLRQELMEDLDLKISETKKTLCSDKEEEKFIGDIERVIKVRSKSLLLIN